MAQDRSPQIAALFQAELDAHGDPATVRVKLSGGDGYVPPAVPIPRAHDPEEENPVVAAAFEEFLATVEIDPTEQCYKVFIHHAHQDRFVEYDLFCTPGDTIEIPPWADWGQEGS